MQKYIKSENGKSFVGRKIFWMKKFGVKKIVKKIFFSKNESCHRQTTRQTDRQHRRVTSRVAPCEQQGATKTQAQTHMKELSKGRNSCTVTETGVGRRNVSA